MRMPFVCNKVHTHEKNTLRPALSIASLWLMFYNGKASLFYACSSVDRAMVSGTMCGGSIPFRRTIILHVIEAISCEARGRFFSFSNNLGKEQSPTRGLRTSHLSDYGWTSDTIFSMSFTSNSAAMIPPAEFQIASFTW